MIVNDNGKIVNDNGMIVTLAGSHVRQKAKPFIAATLQSFARLMNYDERYEERP